MADRLGQDTYFLQNIEEYSSLEVTRQATYSKQAAAVCLMKLFDKTEKFTIEVNKKHCLFKDIFGMCIILILKSVLILLYIWKIDYL